MSENQCFIQFTHFKYFNISSFQTYRLYITLNFPYLIEYRLNLMAVAGVCSCDHENYN